MLKIIHKGTTVGEVLSDPDIVKDMDSRLNEVELMYNKPACKRVAQKGDNVHCWIEVSETKLQDMKSTQTDFLRKV